MNILLLSDDMQLGGVPRHVVDLANGLAEHGHGVIVCASDGPSRALLNSRVRFVALQLLQTGTYRKQWLGPTKAFPRLVSLVRREDIDVIHSHKRFTDLLGRAVALSLNRPHVSTCHNTFDDFYRLSVFGHQTIACSKSIEEMLIRRFHKKPESVSVVYVGLKHQADVSEAEQARMRSQLDIGATDRVICSIGHLSRAKDRSTLLRAVARLNEQNALQRVVCVIVGDGEEEQALKEYVRNRRLEERVRLLPGSTDVATVMKISEFAVLSSVQEGIPYVLLEAAWFAKAHVATDVGGVKEFVEPGVTGILVPPRDPEALATAIRQLIESPDKARELGANARERCLVQHSYDTFLRSVVEVYEKSMQSRRQ